MTTLVRLNNCKIKVFGGQREHPPPHVHLKGPNTDCTIDLATLDVMKGDYSQSDLDEALEWLEEAKNYTAAWDEWRRLNERE
jgi:Domain of unknown function (DUF4160)